MATNRSLQVAQTLHRQGRTADAEDMYRELLLAQPDALEILESLAVMLFQQGRPRDAIPLFARVVAIRPASPARTPTWVKPSDSLAGWPKHARTSTEPWSWILRCRKPGTALASWRSINAASPMRSGPTANRSGLVPSSQRHTSTWESRCTRWPRR